MSNLVNNIKNNFNNIAAHLKNPNPEKQVEFGYECIRLAAVVTATVSLFFTITASSLFSFCGFLVLTVCAHDIFQLATNQLNLQNPFSLAQLRHAFSDQTTQNTFIARPIYTLIS